MAEYVPRIKTSLEEVEHERWLEDKVRELLVWKQEAQQRLEAYERQNATGAGQTNRINNRVEEIAGHVSKTQGFPGGGFGGWVPRRRSDGSGIIWGPDLMGAEPACSIYLGGVLDLPDWERAWWTSEIIGLGDGLSDPTSPFDITQGMMPKVEIWGETFTNVDLSSGTGWRDGHGSSWGNWQNAGAARYYIQLDPRFEGETFMISLPLNQTRMFFESPWSHIDLTVLNAGGADSDLGANVVFEFLGGYYEGTRIAPGEWHNDPETLTDDYDARQMSLVPGEWIDWRVENIGGGSGTATSRIIPANGYTLPEGYTNPAWLHFSGASGDRWWEKNVRARQHVLPFSWMGPLAVAGGEHEWVNYSRELRTVGFIAATATTPSTSGPILIDIRIGGESILTEPLAIPEGEKRGTATPAPSRWPIGSSGPYTFPGALGQIELAKWDPEVELTAHVVDPGTGAANVTIQVFYG